MTQRHPEDFAGSPWLALPASALGPEAAVPTMLSPEEQALYLWLGSHWARGAGAVVDLGCFVGGSTARLAEGLARAGLPGEVHAYDRFTAKEATKRGQLYARGIPRFEGNDLLPLATRLLAPWKDRVRLHRGDLAMAAWDGGPIEILTLDASKTPEAMDAMAQAFFPALIPGQSIIVQQDFLHWRQPWVIAQMELFAGHFRPVAHCPRDTMVFLCTRPIDATALEIGRIAGMEDSVMLSHLADARLRYRPFGLAPQVRATIRALRANPGQRIAWKFRRPRKAARAAAEAEAEAED